ncbi:hypothetical protein I308_100970 [Cryptococcus tetragattii IND107]|uniref:Uncharacterized protein n=1 Tax=Cryptococcus tetragattii IND107 TaxID=1296105 RepID=A0ABR3C1E9_9TREE
MPSNEAGVEKTSSVTHPSRVLTPASTGPGTTPTKDKPACCLLLLSTCFWRALWARVYYASLSQQRESRFFSRRTKEKSPDHHLSSSTLCSSDTAHQ